MKTENFIWFILLSLAFTSCGYINPYFRANNLIDNAIRYGLSAQVSLSQADGNAIICIEDSGPGIPAERMSTVFEPFVRGEESRNTETGGAGLGLSIARSIIRAHGGTIELHNKSPSGLSACVLLPMTE